MLSRFKAWFKRLQGRSAGPSATPAPQGSQELLFGFKTSSTQEGWTVTAVGPAGAQCGRTLTGVTHEQMATVTLGGAQATELHQARALADAWEEACNGSETNEGVINHFADAMTRINQRDPRA